MATQAPGDKAPAQKITLKQIGLIALLTIIIAAFVFGGVKLFDSPGASSKVSFGSFDGEPIEFYQDGRDGSVMNSFYFKLFKLYDDSFKQQYPDDPNVSKWSTTLSLGDAQSLYAMSILARKEFEKAGYRMSENLSMNTKLLANAYSLALEQIFDIRQFESKAATDLLPMLRAMYAIIRYGISSGADVLETNYQLLSLLAKYGILGISKGEGFFELPVVWFKSMAQGNDEGFSARNSFALPGVLVPSELALKRARELASVSRDVDYVRISADHFPLADVKAYGESNGEKFKRLTVSVLGLSADEKAAVEAFDAMSREAGFATGETAFFDARVKALGLDGEERKNLDEKIKALEAEGMTREKSPELDAAKARVDELELLASVSELKEAYYAYGLEGLLDDKTELAGILALPTGSVNGPYLVKSPTGGRVYAAIRIDSAAASPDLSDEKVIAEIRAYLKGQEKDLVQGKLREIAESIAAAGPEGYAATARLAGAEVKRIESMPLNSEANNLVGQFDEEKYQDFYSMDEAMQKALYEAAFGSAVGELAKPFPDTRYGELGYFVLRPVAEKKDASKGNVEEASFIAYGKASFADTLQKKILSDPARFINRQAEALSSLGLGLGF